MAGREVFQYHFVSMEELNEFVSKASNRSAFTGVPRDHGGKMNIMNYYGFSLISHNIHFPCALIWLLISPLQFSTSLRSRFPTAHRYMGRVFLILSLFLAVSGILFHPTGISMSSKTAPISVTTTLLDSATAMGVWSLITGYFAYVHARNRAIVKHREWMIRHVAAGYSVGAMRLHFFAAIASYQLGLFGKIENGLPAYKAETFAFAASSWLALISSIIGAELVVRNGRKQKSV